MKSQLYEITKGKETEPTIIMNVVTREISKNILFEHVEFYKMEEMMLMTL